MQNLCREPHSSVTVRRFCKLKSCYYVIAISSGWHPCPNPNCNARFWSKKKDSFVHFLPSSCILNHTFTTQPWIEPGWGWLVAEHDNHYTAQLTQCSDKMSYLNQMYEKKAKAHAWAFAWLACTPKLSGTGQGCPWTGSLFLETRTVWNQFFIYRNRNS